MDLDGVGDALERALDRAHAVPSIDLAQRGEVGREDERGRGVAREHVVGAGLHRGDRGCDILQEREERRPGVDTT